MSPQNTVIGPDGPCVRCARFESCDLAFIHATFFPHGIAEWLARIDHVHSTLAIGDFAHLRWGMFAILADCSQFCVTEMQDDIHHFAGNGKGGVKGHQNCEQNVRDETAPDKFLNRYEKAV